MGAVVVRISVLRKSHLQFVPCACGGSAGYSSIDKRRANSKDSLEIIKYIVIKGIVTYGRKLIIFTNFLA